MIRARLFLSVLAVLVAGAGHGQGNTKGLPDLPAGVGDVFVLTVGAYDMGLSNTLDHVIGNSIAGGEYIRTCISGGCSLVGTVRLPTGALIDHIELDACDDDAANDVSALLLDCDDGNFGPGPCTTLDTVTTSGTPGCTYVAGATLDSAVINLTHDYLVNAIVPQGGINDSGLRGVKIYYRLQVSSAQGQPTFNDVPASDPAFQFIEAFTAAGITAGCSTSPPLFCPDAAVTRRQMAVFFAKALGLNYPY